MVVEEQAELITNLLARFYSLETEVAAQKTRIATLEDRVAMLDRKTSRAVMVDISQIPSQHRGDATHE